MKTFAVTKAYPGEVVCGDAWVTLALADGVRVAVVDGSGHGEAAAAASQRAIDSLRESVSEPLPIALSRCHSALRGSRGAALSVADITREQIRFAGIGNVEGRIVMPWKEMRLAPQRGIAGVAMPAVRPQALELPVDQCCLLLYSDGVSQKLRARWEQLIGAPERFVREAVEEWGRSTDDATLLLVSCGEP